MQINSPINVKQATLIQGVHLQQLLIMSAPLRQCRSGTSSEWIARQVQKLYAFISHILI